MAEGGWGLVLSELGITTADPHVWQAIALARVLGGACLLFGT